MIPESFHFLRPAWLLALLPVAALLVLALRSDRRASAWRRIVDQHLLRHLMIAGDGATRRWPLGAAAAALTAACVALAGPAWQRVPQPTFSASEPTVIALDLSPSMNVDDLSPSRLGRARHKLHDLLERTRGGQVGLVLYTDEPFVAAPLTDDARVIEEMIPSLERGLMPPRPGRADRAIEQANALLDQAGARTGRIVLVTDGVDERADATLAAARAVEASGRMLSVLGAGTQEGAPLRDGRGRIVEDANGKAVTSSLDTGGLQELASAGGGRFAALAADDADLAALLPARTVAGFDAKAAPSGASARADVWRDAGIFLVLIPLLLAPLAFRRGLVAALALGLLAAAPARAEATTWSDLWSRPDQQGQAALAAGDAASAASLFEDPAWKAAAHYQSGDFDSSVEAYGGLPGAENQYNLGNALARSGKLEQAIAAYEQTLASVPEHADARFNRDLVQKLIDEQKQQQQEQNQQQSGSGGQQDEQAQGQQGAQDQPGQQQQQQQQQQQDGSAGTQQADQQQDGSAAAAQQQQASAGDEAEQQGHDQAAAQPQPQQGEQHADAPQQGEQHADAPQQGEQHADAAQPGDGAARDEPGAARPEAAAGDQRADDASGVAAQANSDLEQAEQDRSLSERLSEALQGDAEAEPKPETADGAATGAGRQPMTEREQAREQALRNIPDDPGGLLRAKIRRRYAEKRYSQQEVTSPW